MPPQSWTGDERRQDADARTRLTEHTDRRFDELEALIRSGFPDGDLDGHRRAHAAVIAIQNEKDKLWSEVRTKIVTGAVWGACGLLALAAWEYLKAEIRR